MTDRAARLARHRVGLIVLSVFGLVGIPGLYLAGVIDIETVNTLGRYLTYAMVAIGLDLIWGYAGILSLCQALFFAIGAYGVLARRNLIIVLMSLEMSATTPPFGLLLYIMMGMVRGTTLFEVASYALPFLFCDLILIILLVMAPGIALFLPSLM